jgi:transposase
MFMNKILSISEREELLQKHRNELVRRSADRIKAVLLADEGLSYRQISRVLFLDEQTIGRHVEQYLEEQKLTSDSGGCYKGKLNSIQSCELVTHLEEITYMKIEEICEYVSNTYGILYTVAGMTSWMRAHGFSYKKPAATPAKADPESQRKFINHYESLINSIPEYEPILFGDGVHPTMATKICCGWIRTGVNKPIATTASRTRVNLMGAINLENMGLVIDEYETIDSLSMEQFLTKVRNHYPRTPTIHLILDRGPYNTSKLTQIAARKLNIILHYLPPYSPNLNPIERLWKVMNENVRNNRVFSSAKEFRHAILHFFKVTWPKMAMSMTERINDNFQVLNPTV